ncbi:MAG: SDR family NAD(P)-dependent oxidoreductase [Candidatus Sulfotelmatobacter sp.]|jgi:NAD(P)-dependent dehydrogenase (short-subunit alcohol dehydrogenase family)
MQGKVVLVTGANGGLGTYVTQAFLDADATVIGTSRKIQPSDFSSPSFTAVAAEISSREGAQVLVDQVVARFGRLDVLAHTVGGFAGGHSIADTDDEIFQRMLDLNLNSVFHILRATIPALRQTGLAGCLGLGRSEFIGLKWSDINWQDSTLTVQRGVVNCNVGNPKTLARRTFPSADTLMKAIPGRWTTNSAMRTRSTCGEDASRRRGSGTRFIRWLNL